MKASMMLTHTGPRPSPISLRPSLIPKPPAPTARGIPPNAQICKIASPTWKPLFLIILYIRIRISIQEWSVGYSGWFSHGQSNQWLAGVQIEGRRRGRGGEPLSGPYRIEGVRSPSWSRSRSRSSYVSRAVRWQAGGYSIQVAATRPRALKSSRLPYLTKTRNWFSDAHSWTTKQTTRRSRVIVLALQT
jgi:hypothetical protein